MWEKIGIDAKKASQKLSLRSRPEKDHLILGLADKILEEKEYILQENKSDVEKAKQNGISEALIDRLTLTDERLTGIVKDLAKIVDLEDPVGQVFEEKEMPNGLKVHKLRVPIGVIGVIYESRPNVTVDVASLALKTGNCTILRGGSETIHSNLALVNVIQKTLIEHQFPKEAVQFIDNPDRKIVEQMLQMHEYIDMLIPRGSEKLHRYCRENSQIPVITGGIGICHLFVDESTQLEPALDVIQNAKIQRPSVCNALDTVLVHNGIASSFIPKMVKRLSEHGVEIHMPEEDIRSSNIGEYPNLVQAGPEDFDKEWLSLTLGVKIVNNLEEALDHITLHSTGHSDGILTQDHLNARKFVQAVDSATVYINASTRFTDGAQLGLGAEVAVSTQKLHARGPMALQELTTYKWVIEGNYHTRT